MATPLNPTPVNGRSITPTVLVLVVIALLGTGVAVGLVLFLLPGGAYQPEQTAKYLPAETQVYYSLNLRPGNDQLKKFKVILERFRENPRFQAKVDEFFDDGEAESGIHIKDDVLPWLGPEIAVGVLDLAGSIVATSTGGTPLVVVIVGTTDQQQSMMVLTDWLSYQTDAEGLDFQADAYEGLIVHTTEDGFHNYAATGDYLVFSTDRDLLKDTIDRIQDGDSTGSLYADLRFQEARKLLPDPHYSTLYVNSDAIWKDTRRQFGGEFPLEARRQIDEIIPEWVTLTCSLIDKGLRLDFAAPIRDKTVAETSRTNSVSSRRLLPSDTLAFLSFSVEPDLKSLRESLREQPMEDLGGYGMWLFGSPIDPDGNMEDLLDEGLKSFQQTVGLDAERDVLDWMSGEISAAVLPSDFGVAFDDPTRAALQAVALIEFDESKRESVDHAVNTVLEFLETTLDLSAHPITYGDGRGAVFNLEEIAGPTAYRPGYLTLSDHLVIGTTGEALRAVSDAAGGQRDSLAQHPKYAQLEKAISVNKNPLVYVDLEEITEAVVMTLDTGDFREYRREVEPFVEPLSSLMMAGDTQGDVGRFSVIVTID